MKIYLENGNAIKTDWNDSIALSYVPTKGRASLPYAVTIEKYVSAGGDFVNKDLNITPVLIANKYFVIKDLSGTIQTTHYFNDLSFSQAGSYRFIYEKSSLGVVSLQVFRGENTTDVIFDTSLTGNTNDNKFVYTLNTDIPNDTSFEGIIEYENGVVCIGDEVSLSLGATERARCFSNASNPLYTLAGNQLRFYIKDLGCYKLLNDTSATTKEVSNDNIIVDSLIKKSNIVSVSTIANLNSVNIKFENNTQLKVNAIDVLNKSFTDDNSGLTLMYNTIQSWL